jgi:hypothetical protein
MFWLGLKRGPNSYIAPSDFKLKNYAQKITSLKTPSIKALLIDLKICYKVNFCPFWLATLYRITSLFL